MLYTKIFYSVTILITLKRAFRYLYGIALEGNTCVGLIRNNSLLRNKPKHRFPPGLFIGRLFMNIQVLSYRNSPEGAKGKLFV